MKKVELEVMAMSYSMTSESSYVVVLSDKNSDTKIPVIVKGSDAQNISIKMEKIETKRPLTHDLFKSFTDEMNIVVKQIDIYSVTEGIFYTRIVTEDKEIECGIGDGIALSLVYGCPLYAYDEVIKLTGIHITDDGDMINEPQIKSEPNVKDLEIDMKFAIENEDYELAAKLRDRIEKLKNNN